MNTGLAIFRKMQRLQQGSKDVRYTPVTPTKEYPYSTDYEFIHRKIPEQGRDADLAHLTPEEQMQEQLDWEQNIKEILTSTPDLTPEERKQVTDLNPKDWDDSTKEKVGAAAEKPDDIAAFAEPTPLPGTYAKGASNVTNNPGLLFYRKQLVTKPKRKEKIK